MISVVITVMFMIIFINGKKTNIIISIIDTGVDTKNIGFGSNIINCFNLFDPNASCQDDNGHGNQVFSSIHFLQSHVKIIPIKAIGRSGIASKGDLASAIIISVDYGANIINISSGAEFSSPDLEKAVAYAEDKNVLIVAAAGGDDKGVDYPAAYPTVLAVGAVDYRNALLSNSDVGEELDLVTLGEYKTIGINNECRMGSGTSLSAPIVSAYAANILMGNPGITVELLRSRILSSLIDIGKPGRDESTGYGLLPLIVPTMDICK